MADDEKLNLKSEMRKLHLNYILLKDSQSSTAKYLLENLIQVVNKYNDRYTKKCVHCLKDIEYATIDGIIYNFACCDEAKKKISFHSDK